MPFTRYAEFRGRSCRSEYWLFTLLNSGVGILLLVFTGVNAPADGSQSAMSELGALLYLAWVLICFVPSLAVLVRRLHDTDRSGWMALLSFVPIVGIIVVIIFLATRGTDGPNRYGENPLGGGGAGGWQDEGPTVAAQAWAASPDGTARRSAQGVRLSGFDAGGHVVRASLTLDDPRLQNGGIKIGRDPGCTIVLGDPSVSRAHAQCAIAGGAIVIKDLASANGTRINGRVLTPGQDQELRAGDQLQLGETELSVSSL